MDGSFRKAESAVPVLEHSTSSLRGGCAPVLTLALFSILFWWYGLDGWIGEQIGRWLVGWLVWHERYGSAS